MTTAANAHQKSEAELLLIWEWPLPLLNWSQQFSTAAHDHGTAQI